MVYEIAFAYLHYVSILLTVSALIAEKVLYQKPIDISRARRLARIDIVYFVGAMLILGTGFSRALWFAKPSIFYFSNPVFWTKVGLFGLWALLSVPPTLHFLSWRKELSKNQAPKISDSEYRRVRFCLMSQAGLAAMIPLLAVLMSRGIGL